MACFTFPWQETTFNERNQQERKNEKEKYKSNSEKSNKIIQLTLWVCEKNS